MHPRHCQAAFSLIELVIVIVIIGVVAAVAIPRITRGAGNAGGAALKADLAILRRAIETYRAEHEGKRPTKANFVKQMTEFTNIDGTVWSDQVDVSNRIIYGPYLVSVPPLRVGGNANHNGVGDNGDADTGWVYDEQSGEINSNTTDTEVDNENKRFNRY